MGKTIKEKTFQSWFDKHVDDDDCTYILEYGISKATPSGLIYYSETAALYESFTKEIWDIAMEDVDTLADIVRENDIVCQAHFENYMVWYAATLLAVERAGGWNNARTRRAA